MMRAIDDYTPQQIEMLQLKGMLPERRQWQEPPADADAAEALNQLERANEGEIG